MNNNHLFHNKFWFWLQVVTCLFIIAGVLRHWEGNKIILSSQACQTGLTMLSEQKNR